MGVFRVWSLCLGAALCLAGCHRGGEATASDEGSAGSPSVPNTAEGGAPDDGSAPPRSEFLPLSPEVIAQLRTEDAAGALVLPSPDEIFRAMSVAEDGALAPDWATMSSNAAPGGDSTSAALVALSAGAELADFFVAVRLEDPERCRALSERLLARADALGVGGAARAHAEGLTGAIDAGDWDRVRQEMTNVFETIRTELPSDEPSRVGDLVAIGAWSQGLNLVTHGGSPAPASALGEILRQAEVAEYFVGRLAVPGANDEVQALGASLLGPLRALQAAMSFDAQQPLGDEGVGQIRSSLEVIRALLP